MSKMDKLKKKALSEMLSYVILISIVIGLSIGVFAYLKNVSQNVNPPADCNEGTSVNIESYQCLGDLRITIKNTGRFAVDGVIVAVGNDSNKQPDVFLLSSNFSEVLQGHYVFSQRLLPGNLSEARYKSITKDGKVKFQNATIIQVQPFIIDKNSVIRCTNAVITQKINNCRLVN
jgi:hypothetical protein